MRSVVCRLDSFGAKKANKGKRATRSPTAVSSVQPWVVLELENRSPGSWVPQVLHCAYSVAHLQTATLCHMINCCKGAPIGRSTVRGPPLVQLLFVQRNADMGLEPRTSSAASHVLFDHPHGTVGVCSPDRIFVGGMSVALVIMAEPLASAALTDWRAPTKPLLDGTR